MKTLRRNQTPSARLFAPRKLLSTLGTVLALSAWALLKPHAQDSGSGGTSMIAPGTATPEARAVLRALARDEILHPDYQPALTADAVAAIEAISHPKPPGVNMTPAEVQALASISHPVTDLSLMTSEQQLALAAILNPKTNSVPTGRWFFDADQSQIPPLPSEPDPLVFPVPQDNSAMPASVSR